MHLNAYVYYIAPYACNITHKERQTSELEMLLDLLKSSFICPSSLLNPTMDDCFSPTEQAVPILNPHYANNFDVSNHIKSVRMNVPQNLDKN